MRPADKAWLVMATGIVIYEACADDGELLSEGWDRYLTGKRKVAAYTTPFLVAGHLTNLLPLWLDPIALVFRLIQRLTRA
jgi:hypothetical protein